MQRLGKAALVQRVEPDQNADFRRLNADLRRVTEQRDSLKKDTLSWEIETRSG